MKQKSILKATALFTLCAFASNQILFAQSLQGYQGTREVPSLPAPEFAVPQELGTVTEVWGENPKLLLIQDAHGQYEAQKNIEALLDLLNRKAGVRRVFIEGGVGKLNPGLLRFFEEDEFNLKAADVLAREAEIGGPELFLLKENLKTGPKAPEAYGVEDPDLYLRNLESFGKVSDQKQKADAFLETSLTGLIKLASTQFSPAVYKFFREWLRYEESGDLTRYIGVLQAEASKSLNLDLADPRSQLDWPMLVRFADLKARESRLDLEQTRKEREKLLNWCRGQNLDPDLVRFLKDEKRTQSPEFREKFEDLRSFWEAFFSAARNKGFAFRDYPNLALWEGARILEGEIDAVRLFSELDGLRDRILEKSTRGEKEERLVERAKDFLLLKKLFALRITRPEFETLQARFRKSGLNEKFPKEIENLYREAENFYRLAQERDRVMLENFLNQNRPFEGAGFSVLIAGGFHTSGLMERLKEKNIAYAVVTPHMSEVGSDEKYFASMRGDKPKLDFQNSSSRDANWMMDWGGRLPPRVSQRHQEIIRQILEWGRKAGAVPRSEMRVTGVEQLLLLHGLSDKERGAKIKQALESRRDNYNLTPELIGRAEGYLRDFGAVPGPSPMREVPEINEFFSKLLGRKVRLLFKDETVNVTGSFKDRAPIQLYHLVASGIAPKEVIAVSTGNHGAATAAARNLAAAYQKRKDGRELRTKARVFMGKDALPHKKDKIRSFGAEVVDQDHGRPIASYKSAESIVEKLVHPPEVIQIRHADPYVVSGYSVAGREIVRQLKHTQGLKAGKGSGIALISPLGSGGYYSGLMEALSELPEMRTYGASATPANLTFRSVEKRKKGEGSALVRRAIPKTKVDGIAATPEQYAVEMIEQTSDGLLLVPEDATIPFTALLQKYGLTVEPTSSLGPVAFLMHPELFEGIDTFVFPLTSKNVSPEIAREIGQLLHTGNPEDMLREYYEAALRDRAKTTKTEKIKRSEMRAADNARLEDLVVKAVRGELDDVFLVVQDALIFNAPPDQPSRAETIERLGQLADEKDIPLGLLIYLTFLRFPDYSPPSWVKTYQSDGQMIAATTFAVRAKQFADHFQIWLERWYHDPNDGKQKGMWQNLRREFEDLKKEDAERLGKFVDLELVTGSLEPGQIENATRLRLLEIHGDMIFSKASWALEEVLQAARQNGALTPAEIEKFSYPALVAVLEILKSGRTSIHDAEGKEYPVSEEAAAAARRRVEESEVRKIGAVIANTEATGAEIDKAAALLGNIPLGFQDAKWLWSQFLVLEDRELKGPFEPLLKAYDRRLHEFLVAVSGAHTIYHEIRDIENTPLFGGALFAVPVFRTPHQLSDLFYWDQLVASWLANAGSRRVEYQAAVDELLSFVRQRWTSELLQSMYRHRNLVLERPVLTALAHESFAAAPDDTEDTFGAVFQTVEDFYSRAARGNYLEPIVGQREPVLHQGDPVANIPLRPEGFIKVIHAIRRDQAGYNAPDYLGKVFAGTRYSQAALEAVTYNAAGTPQLVSMHMVPIDDFYGNMRQVQRNLVFILRKMNSFNRTHQIPGSFDLTRGYVTLYKQALPAAGALYTLRVTSQPIPIALRSEQRVPEAESFLKSSFLRSEMRVNDPEKNPESTARVEQVLHYKLFESYEDPAVPDAKRLRLYEVLGILRKKITEARKSFPDETKAWDDLEKLIKQAKWARFGAIVSQVQYATLRGADDYLLSFSQIKEIETGKEKKKRPETTVFFAKEILEGFPVGFASEFAFREMAASFLTPEKVGQTAEKLFPENYTQQVLRDKQFLRDRIRDFLRRRIIPDGLEDYLEVLSAAEISLIQSEATGTPMSPEVLRGYGTQLQPIILGMGSGRRYLKDTIFLPLQDITRKKQSGALSLADMQKHAADIGLVDAVLRDTVKQLRIAIQDGELEHIAQDYLQYFVYAHMIEDHPEARSPWLEEDLKAVNREVEEFVVSLQKDRQDDKTKFTAYMNVARNMTKAQHQANQDKRIDFEQTLPLEKARGLISGLAERAPLLRNSLNVQNPFWLEADAIDRDVQDMIQAYREALSVMQRKAEDIQLPSAYYPERRSEMRAHFEIPVLLASWFDEIPSSGLLIGLGIGAVALLIYRHFREAFKKMLIRDYPERLEAIQKAVERFEKEASSKRNPEQIQKFRESLAKEYKTRFKTLRPSPLLEGLFGSVNLTQLGIGIADRLERRLEYKLAVAQGRVLRKTGLSRKEAAAYWPENISQPWLTQLWNFFVALIFLPVAVPAAIVRSIGRILARGAETQKPEQAKKEKKTKTPPAVVAPPAEKKKAEKPPKLKKEKKLPETVTVQLGEVTVESGAIPPAAETVITPQEAAERALDDFKKSFGRKAKVIVQSALREKIPAKMREFLDMLEREKMRDSEDFSAAQKLDPEALEIFRARVRADQFFEDFKQQIRAVADDLEAQIRDERSRTVKTALDSFDGLAGTEAGRISADIQMRALSQPEAPIDIAGLVSRFREKMQPRLDRIQKEQNLTAEERPAFDVALTDQADKLRQRLEAFAADLELGRTLALQITQIKEGLPEVVQRATAEADALMQTSLELVKEALAEAAEKVKAGFKKSVNPKKMESVNAEAEKTGREWDKQVRDAGGLAAEELPKAKALFQKVAAVALSDFDTKVAALRPQVEAKDPAVRKILENAAGIERLLILPVFETAAGGFTGKTEQKIQTLAQEARVPIDQEIEAARQIAHAEELRIQREQEDLADQEIQAGFPRLEDILTKQMSQLSQPKQIDEHRQVVLFRQKIETDARLGDDARRDWLAELSRFLDEMKQEMERQKAERAKVQAKKAAPPPKQNTSRKVLPLLNEGRSLLGQGKYQEANKVFEQIAVDEQAPVYLRTRALSGAAKAQSLSGDYDAALNAVDFGLELEPENNVLAGQRAWILYDLGRTAPEGDAKKTDHFRASAAQSEMILQREPENIDARLVHISALLEIGEDLDQVGQLIGALRGEVSPAAFERYRKRLEDKRAGRSEMRTAGSEKEIAAEVLKGLEIKKPVMRILVVEDDDATRGQVASAVLKGAGASAGHLQMDQAANGEEGLRSMISRSYDLVITDINMPKLEGDKMIEQARDRGRRFPTLVHSSFKSLKSTEGRPQVVHIQKKAAYDSYKVIEELIRLLNEGPSGEAPAPQPLRLAGIQEWINEIILSGRISVTGDLKENPAQIVLKYSVDAEDQAVEDYLQQKLGTAGVRPAENRLMDAAGQLRTYLESRNYFYDISAPAQNLGNNEWQITFVRRSEMRTAPEHPEEDENGIHGVWCRHIANDLLAKIRPDQAPEELVMDLVAGKFFIRQKAEGAEAGTVQEFPMSNEALRIAEWILRENIRTVRFDGELVAAWAADPDPEKKAGAREFVNALKHTMTWRKQGGGYKLAPSVGPAWRSGAVRTPAGLEMRIEQWASTGFVQPKPQAPSRALAPNEFRLSAENDLTVSGFGKPDIFYIGLSRFPFSEADTKDEKVWGSPRFMILSQDPAVVFYPESRWQEILKLGKPVTVLKSDAGRLNEKKLKNVGRVLRAQIPRGGEALVAYNTLTRELLRIFFEDFGESEGTALVRIEASDRILKGLKFVPSSLKHFDRRSEMRTAEITALVPSILDTHSQSASAEQFVLSPAVGQLWNSIEEFLTGSTVGTAGLPAWAQDTERLERLLRTLEETVRHGGSDTAYQFLEVQILDLVNEIRPDIPRPAQIKPRPKVTVPASVTRGAQDVYRYDGFEGQVLTTTDERLAAILPLIKENKEIPEEAGRLTPRTARGHGEINFATLQSGETKKGMSFVAASTFAAQPVTPVIFKSGDQEYMVGLEAKSPFTGETFIVSSYVLARNGQILTGKPVPGNREVNGLFPADQVPFSTFPVVKEILYGLALGKLPEKLRRFTEKDLKDAGLEGLFGERAVNFWKDSVRLDKLDDYADPILTLEPAPWLLPEGSKDPAPWVATLWTKAEGGRPEIPFASIVIYSEKDLKTKQGLDIKAGFTRSRPFVDGRRGFEKIAGEVAEGKRSFHEVFKVLWNILWLAGGTEQVPTEDPVAVKHGRDEYVYRLNNQTVAITLGAEFAKGQTNRAWVSFPNLGPDARGIRYQNIKEGEVVAEKYFLLFKGGRFQEPEETTKPAAAALPLAELPVRAVPVSTAGLRPGQAFHDSLSVETRFLLVRERQKVLEEMKKIDQEVAEALQLEKDQQAGALELLAGRLRELEKPARLLSFIQVTGQVPTEGDWAKRLAFERTPGYGTLKSSRDENREVFESLVSAVVEGSAQPGAWQSLSETFGGIAEGGLRGILLPVQTVKEKRRLYPGGEKGPYISMGSYAKEKIFVSASVETKGAEGRTFLRLRLYDPDHPLEPWDSFYFDPEQKTFVDSKEEWKGWFSGESKQGVPSDMISGSITDSGKISIFRSFKGQADLTVHGALDLGRAFYEEVDHKGFYPFNNTGSGRRYYFRASEEGGQKFVTVYGSPLTNPENEIATFRWIADDPGWKQRKEGGTGFEKSGRGPSDEMTGYGNENQKRILFQSWLAGQMLEYLEIAMPATVGARSKVHYPPVLGQTQGNAGFTLTGADMGTGVTWRNVTETVPERAVDLYDQNGAYFQRAFYSEDRPEGVNAFLEAIRRFKKFDRSVREGGKEIPEPILYLKASEKMAPDLELLDKKRGAGKGRGTNVFANALKDIEASGAARDFEWSQIWLEYGTVQTEAGSLPALYLIPVNAAQGKASLAIRVVALGADEYRYDAVPSGFDVSLEVLKRMAERGYTRGAGDVAYPEILARKIKDLEDRLERLRRPETAAPKPFSEFLNEIVEGKITTAAEQSLIRDIRYPAKTNQDAVTVTYTFVGAAEGHQAKTFEARLTEGVNRIVLEETDHAGAKVTTPITIILDKEAPKILDIQAPAKTNQAEITITYTVKDNVDGLTPTRRRKVQLVEGLNTVQLEAADEAGNRTTVEVRIILDTKPPEITDILAPEKTELSKVTVAYTVRDEVDGEKKFTREVELALGENRITLHARDEAGNTATAQVVIVREAPKPAPVPVSQVPIAVVPTPEVPVFAQDQVTYQAWPAEMAALDRKFFFAVPSTPVFSQRLKLLRELREGYQALEAGIPVVTPSNVLPEPDLGVSWENFRKNFKKEMRPTPVLIYRPQDYAWDRYKPTSPEGRAFMGILQGQILKIQQEHPDMHYFWVEMAPAFYDRGKEKPLRPVLYVTGLDPEKGNASPVYRILEKDRNKFTEPLQNTIEQKPFTHPVFGAMAQFGYARQGTEILPDILRGRLELVNALIEAEEKPWDDIQAMEDYLQTGFLAHLEEARRAQGAASFPKPEKAPKEYTTGPSPFEIAFLLRSRNVAEVFTLANKIVGPEGVSPAEVTLPAIEDALAFLDALNQNKEIENALGYQEFRLDPTSILHTRLSYIQEGREIREDLTREKLLEWALRAALQIEEVRKLYDVPLVPLEEILAARAREAQKLAEPEEIPVPEPVVEIPAVQPATQTEIPSQTQAIPPVVQTTVPEIVPVPVEAVPAGPVETDAERLERLKQEEAEKWQAELEGIAANPKAALNFAENYFYEARALKFKDAGRFEELLGHSQDLLAALTDYLDSLHPEDQVAYQALGAQILEIQKARVSDIFDFLEPALDILQRHPGLPREAEIKGWFQSLVPQRVAEIGREMTESLRSLENTQDPDEIAKFEGRLKTGLEEMKRRAGSDFGTQKWIFAMAVRRDIHALEDRMADDVDMRNTYRDDLIGISRDLKRFRDLYKDRDIADLLSARLNQLESNWNEARVRGPIEDLYRDAASGRLQDEQFTSRFNDLLRHMQDLEAKKRLLPEAAERLGSLLYQTQLAFQGETETEAPAPVKAVSQPREPLDLAQEARQADDLVRQIAQIQKTLQRRKEKELAQVATLLLRAIAGSQTDSVIRHRKTFAAQYEDLQSREKLSQDELFGQIDLLSQQVVRKILKARSEMRHQFQLEDKGDFVEVGTYEINGHPLTIDVAPLRYRIWTHGDEYLEWEELSNAHAPLHVFVDQPKIKVDNFIRIQFLDNGRLRIERLIPKRAQKEPVLVDVPEIVELSELWDFVSERWFNGTFLFTQVMESIGSLEGSPVREVPKWWKQNAGEILNLVDEARHELEKTAWQSQPDSDRIREIRDHLQDLEADARNLLRDMHERRSEMRTQEITLGDKGDTAEININELNGHWLTLDLAPLKYRIWTFNGQYVEWSELTGNDTNVNGYFENNKIRVEDYFELEIKNGGTLLIRRLVPKRSEVSPLKISIPEAVEPSDLWYEIGRKWFEAAYKYARAGVGYQNERQSLQRTKMRDFWRKDIIESQAAITDALEQLGRVNWQAQPDRNMIRDLEGRLEELREGTQGLLEKINKKERRSELRLITPEAVREVATAMTGSIVRLGDRFSNVFESVVPAAAAEESAKKWLTEPERKNLVSAYAWLFGRAGQAVLPARLLMKLPRQAREEYLSVILEAMKQNKGSVLYFAGREAQKLHQEIFGYKVFRNFPDLDAGKFIKVVNQEETLVAGTLKNEAAAVSFMGLPQEAGVLPMPAFLLQADEIDKLKEPELFRYLHHLTQLELLAGQELKDALKNVSPKQAALLVGNFLQKAGVEFQTGPGGYLSPSVQSLVAETLTQYLTTQAATAASA